MIMIMMMMRKNDSTAICYFRRGGGGKIWNYSSDVSVHRFATLKCQIVRLKVQQKSDEEQAQLQIPVAKREDTGKYAITVSNPFGQDTGLISVVVLGYYCYYYYYYYYTEYF